MIQDDNPSLPQESAADPPAWPVVSASDIRIAEWDWDLAYMGVYLRLEICNSSPYLVREATLRIDGRGQTAQRVVATRELKVGPLFPGVYVHYNGGPHGWAGCLDALSVQVCEVKLGAPAARRRRSSTWDPYPISVLMTSSFGSVISSMV